jgi:hypothetical protein
VRGRGVNYDTGFYDGSRPSFDPADVRRELQIIADDLHCNAVRISGGDPAKIAVAASYAIDLGLEVWFAPFPVDLTPDEMIEHFAECARRAEELRTRDSRVVLVTGCEVTLFGKGFMEGETAIERIEAAVAGKSLHLSTGEGAMDEQMNRFFATVVERVKNEGFGGRVTYASGKWETVDWGLFDVVSVDLYRDADNADQYVERLRDYRSHGKPLAITEFGCCTFTGASKRGGTGWMILDYRGNPPTIADGYERNEEEQASLLVEMSELYEREGVDSCFWFSFANYAHPHRENPRYDLDLASYGLVKILETQNGTVYPDVAWEPKKSFYALADTYARFEAA